MTMVELKDIVEQHAVDFGLTKELASEMADAVANDVYDLGFWDDKEPYHEERHPNSDSLFDELYD